MQCSICKKQGVNVRTCDCFGSVQLAAAHCLASRELDLVEARLAAEHATAEVTRRADALRVTCYAGGCGIDLAVARILAERAAAEVTRREDMLSIHTPPNVRKRKRAMERRAAELADQKTITAKALSKLNDCAVCMNGKATHMMMPCRHLCVCTTCNMKLVADQPTAAAHRPRECIICRTPIESIITPIYTI